MASKFTADSAGIVSVSRPTAGKCVSVDQYGIASRSVPLAKNDMKPVQGTVSRTNPASDPDGDGH